MFAGKSLPPWVPKPAEVWFGGRFRLNPAELTRSVSPPVWIGWGNPGLVPVGFAPSSLSHPDRGALPGPWPGVAM